MKKSMKKVVSLLLAAVMVISMIAFASVVYAADDSVEVDPDFKMGVILIGDETEGYSAAHIAGIKAAAKELGLDDSQVIWKYKVPEDQTCSHQRMRELKECIHKHLRSTLCVWCCCRPEAAAASG